MDSGFPALGNEFIRKRHPRLEITANQLLRLPYPTHNGANANLITVDPQGKFIILLSSHILPNGRRKCNLVFLVRAHPNISF